MVADNSYEIFKISYTSAVKNKKQSFYFNKSKIDVNYAKFVCAYVDKHCMPEYEEHIIQSQTEPDFPFE